MASILKSIFPVSSSKKDDQDDFDVEYSIAVEYSGPAVSYDIPQVVPVDFHRIPTATVVAPASISKSRNLSLPVIQPIAKRSKGVLATKEASVPKANLGALEGGGEDLACEPVGDDNRKASLDSLYGEECGCKGSDGIESSGTLGFSDIQDDSNEISGSSDAEDSCDDDCKVDVGCTSHLKPRGLDSEESMMGSPDPSVGVLSIQEVEECIDDSQCQENTPGVTFNEIHSSYSTSESDDDDPGPFPEKPEVISDSKKCFRCHKRSMLMKMEVCLVCRAKYCNICVLRAMGAMPEGRKCITCIGFRISEKKRDSLGKCSGMLKSLFIEAEIKRIMKVEQSCKANQLPFNLVSVNGKLLNHRELVMLQTCLHPPKKLKPGRYWYDKVSGFWGKEGRKPCQIISPQLTVGDTIKRDASNGNTDVLINNREITKPELYMLKVIGIHCERSIHFWLSADGAYQQEGMNNVMGKLWEMTGINLICGALQLPTPPKTSKSRSQGTDSQADKGGPSSEDQRTLNKLLLVGCDQSGTSTIFKQAKIQYAVPFREDERQSFKCMIQSNLYNYISILLEGRDQFEEEYRIEMRRKRMDEPGPSVIPDDVEDNIYSISPRFKKFADWLLQIRMAGNLEAIFPASTREYALMVEELWKDKAFLATYQRRNELQMLPRVANYFLDRAVEISRADYEPSPMDILYAEGSTSANGVASMEFSFSKVSQDSYMEPADQNNASIRCQLIRVHASSLGENCKLLEMFEDINIVLYTVSLTDYHEYLEDSNGDLTNKMLESKRLFESIVNHPSFAHKHFVLLLNKFDLLEELIERFPLTECEWFQSFNPVISRHPNSSASNNNPSLAHRAFHYIASQFKALYKSITGRKLYASLVTGLEGETVDESLKYASEILRWDEEKSKLLKEWSTESMEGEASTSVCV
nr:extra-large guanine nucleotide-binding protein 1-like [Ipomoea batatas]